MQIESNLANSNTGRGKNIVAQRRLGLFEKGKKRPLRVTFMSKQMLGDIIRKAEVLATHEENLDKRRYDQR